MFNSSPFSNPEPPKFKIIFVQDFLLSDLVGGAELSMDALHRSAPVPFALVRSSQLTPEMIETHVSCHWVFGNFAHLSPALIHAFSVSRISYSVFEHDYKFCRWRSVEKHQTEGGEVCRCEQEPWGQLIERFYLNAKQVWFCSQRHMQRYFDRFPSLKSSNCSVLSAVFGDEFFHKIVPLVQSLPSRKKSGWLTLDSDSWIKGTDDSKKWLEDNGKSYSFIKGMNPDQVLESMANAEGFVCLPRGADVSNRMVTEAKLLGCQVVTNENVQHVGEKWLEYDQINTLRWLANRKAVFWQRTMDIVDGKISRNYNLLVKFPTRGRPDKFFSVLESYRNLSRSGNIRFVVTCDLDDESMNNDQVKERFKQFDNVEVCYGNSKTKIQAINADMQGRDFDICLLASDDMIPEREGYDLEIINQMQINYPDLDGVIWFSDGYQKRKLNTLTIVGKRYYDRFGYLYHPDYVSFYSDNEFMQVAFMLGKQTYVDEVIIRHQHPDNTKESIDMTYATNNQHVMRDNLTFNKRAQSMFGLAG
jgi:hypothetical protein